MAREFFKELGRLIRCGPGRGRGAAPQGLSREMVKLMIGGPAGSTDLALQTLLLRDRACRKTNRR